MNTARIGQIALDEGLQEVHYLCRLSCDEVDSCEADDEAAALVRESIQHRHAWQAQDFDIDVSVMEHPVLIRGFLAIARLTERLPFAH